MMGWECPKCGRCYAPFVRECEDHGERAIEIPKFSETYTGEKCLTCNGFHSRSIGCPIPHKSGEEE